MRTFLLLALVCVACRGSADGTDAATAVTPKAAAVDSAEDEPEEEAATPEKPTVLRAPAPGPAAARAKSGAVLLCDTHSVWTAPAGFEVTAPHDAVVASHAGELVAVLYPPHADDAYARAAGAFVDGTLTWDAPAMTRIDDWHAESTAHGRGNGLVAVVRTLWAGVDPKTGAGRVGRDLQHPGSDVLWIAIAPTEARADALLGDARKSELRLTDHACECGYDCHPKR